MKTKKEELKKEILNSTSKYDYLILKLINEDKINNLINNINNKKTKINITSLYKKKYLTENEQFLLLLNNTIYYFKEQFYFLNNNIDLVITILLQNKKNTKYLLSKKYIGKNSNIPFFNTSIKKLIITNYYNNLKNLSKESLIIKNFRKEHNLFLEKEINIIYNNLLELSLCNATYTNNILLFESINNNINETEKKFKNKNINKQIKLHYIKEYEKMINNYYEKKQIIQFLLNKNY